MAIDNLFSSSFGQPSVFLDPRRAMLGVRLNLGPMMSMPNANGMTRRTLLRCAALETVALPSGLDANGLMENTIVIFSSDKGGERFADTWPFTGRKSELLEGSVRAGRDQLTASAHAERGANPAQAVLQRISSIT